MNGILIVAHAPLAYALRQCVLHVFPDAGDEVGAVDVQPNASPEETLAAARQALQALNCPQALVLTDMFGATPCNVAQRLADGVNARLVTGVNLPMLLRAVTYRSASLEVLVERALLGGAQGVMQVAGTAPQNQVRRNNDEDRYDHQQ